MASKTASRTNPWQYHSHYNGCVIEHRPGLQRRGFASIYKNGYAGWRLGVFTHHTLENAKKHIDALHNKFGEKIEVTQEEYTAFVRNGYK